MFLLARLIIALRPAILVVVGAVIGAGIAPVVAGSPLSGDAVTPASTQTRAVSCQGLNFHPIDSTTGYSYQGVEIYMTDGGANSTGFFVCAPDLPNGAVVKRVQFTVEDADAGSVRLCGLYRSGLGTTTARTYQPIAQLPSSDATAGGGIKRLSSSSITNATVDNAHYAYWLQCQLTDNIHWLGIYGADVIYAISSVNG